MANPTTGQPPPEVFHHPTTSKTPLDYSHILKPTSLNLKSLATAENPSGHIIPTSIQIPIKLITYLHGEPKICYDMKELELMIVQQELQYAVVGKFSYGWTEINSLRTSIPTQCELKGGVKIGFLCNRHVLIGCTLFEDYVTLMSKPNFWIKEKNTYYSMRTLKWDPWFNPEEETSMELAWISLPALAPNWFGESQLFSLAAAIGKPLTNDVATRNKTRPSCATVKVEVDLLKEHLNRVQIQ